jgi:hypothetical protein
MEQQITLTLSMADVQIVMNALGTRPLSEVFNAFVRIREQLAVAQVQQQRLAEHAPANGSAEPH